MPVRSWTLRWLAAFLLIASPAMGGQLLPLVHPCAAEAAEYGSHEGHGAGHEQAPEGAPCSCLGSCQATAMVVVPQAQIIAAVVPVLRAHDTIAPVGVVVHRLDRPIDRLPPPTAPPIA